MTLEIDRIFSETEITKLKRLLKKQNLPYPNYQDWIDGIPKAIREGKKEALGLFDGKKLVGDLVFRISTSDVAEIKNLYILSNYRKEDSGSRLLYEFESICSERNVSKIEVDTLKDNQDMVVFLVKNGFTVSAKRPMYGLNKESYIFEKSVDKTYRGTLDWEKMSRWVISEKWGFELVKEHPRIQNKKFDGLFERDENGLITRILLEAKGWFSAKVGVDQVTTLLHYTDSIHHPVYSAPEFEDRAKEELEKNGGIWIDQNKMEELTQRKIPRKGGKKFGYLQPIKPEFHKRLEEKKGKRAFVKGSGGKLNLKTGDYLVLYQTAPEKNISSFVEIEQHKNGVPEAIWKEYEKYLVFEESEYFNWSKGKNKVSLFIFKDIKNIDPIPYSQIKTTLGSFSPMGGQYLSTREWEALKEGRKERISSKSEEELVKV